MAKRRQLQPFADPPAPPPPSRPTGLMPREVPRTPLGDGGALPDYTPSSIGQLPSPWTSDVNSPSRFAHLSPGMLGIHQRGRCSITITVVRVELPADLPGRLPRLSCFFTLPSLRKEVRLTAPTKPQYTVLYTDPQVVFEVHSLRDLGQVCREPLTLFFMDEDTTSSAEELFALAICEWSVALERRGVTIPFRLPLLGRDRTVILGATVVVEVRADDSGTTGPATASTTVVENTLPVLDYSRSPPSPTAPQGQGDTSMSVPGLNRENATRTIEEELMRLEFERMSR
ncbi:hypothetical protein AGDE_15617 [Angomonas deanei]|uniref:Uncharacterized protein n=1 Tax=Angomonas deanei TaxID=59799 RepID=A0A7G2CQE2_9TRYP|nr:hypothetical protein AGDE_15617 [Angomonas deanei]CAD2220763.1 hypothetical protein, conserved [Angomonas deanei]|eukprot:EPY18759.1 hypothetical protein AGDE_15617 [Angomonas deanei]